MVLRGFCLGFLLDRQGEPNFAAIFFPPLLTAVRSSSVPFSFALGALYPATVFTLVVVVASVPPLLHHSTRRTSLTKLCVSRSLVLVIIFLCRAPCPPALFPLLLPSPQLRERKQLQAAGWKQMRLG